MKDNKQALNIADWAIRHAMRMWVRGLRMTNPHGDPLSDSFEAVAKSFNEQVLGYWLARGYTAVEVDHLWFYAITELEPSLWDMTLADHEGYATSSLPNDNIDNLFGGES